MSNRRGPIHFALEGKSITACGKRAPKRSSNKENVNCVHCLRVLAGVPGITFKEFEKSILGKKR